MKRLGQLFLSLLFVLTVSTIYFAFDLAVTSMHRPKKNLIDRMEHPMTTTSSASLISTRQVERKLDNNQQNLDPSRRVQHLKRKSSHGKYAQFHKSRTGVKLNAKSPRKHPARTDNRLNIHRPPPPI